MNYSIRRIYLDIHDISSQITIHVKRNDSHRKIIAILTENGKPYTITKECRAEFTAKASGEVDGVPIQVECVPEGNTIPYVISPSVTETIGIKECEFKLYGADKALLTSPRFTIIVDDGIYNGEGVTEGEGEVSILTSLISEASTLVNEIETKLENGEFKGEDGDGVFEVTDLNDIKHDGVYKVNNDLYISSYDDWDTNIATPFYYKGTADKLGALNFSNDKSSIVGGENLEGVPLLRYANTLGSHEGSTYVFLSEDFASLLIYEGDSVGYQPFLASVSLTDSLIKISSDGFGLGTDICGNYELIKRYFKSSSALLPAEKMATITYVNDAIADIVPPQGDLTKYATKEYVEKAIEEIEIPEVDLTGYATEDYVDKAIENIDVPEVDLTGYAKETYVDEAIAAIPKVDLTGYATEKYVNDAIEGIDIPTVDLTNYATKDDVKDAIDAIDIPTVDLTSYATKEYVNDAVDGMGEIFSNAFKVKKKGEVVSITDMSPEETIIDAKLTSKNIYGGEANPNNLIYVSGLGHSPCYLYPTFIPSGTTITVSCDKKEYDAASYNFFGYFDEEKCIINYSALTIETADNRVYNTYTVEKDVYYVCADYNNNAQSTNYQIEVGAMPTPYTPFIDNFENVKVEQYGKNLLPYPYVDTTKTMNGITFTDNGDGSVHVKGYATSTAWFMLSNTIDFGATNINAIEKDYETNGVYAIGKNMFYGANNKQLSINLTASTDIDEIIYPQVELGTTFTGYEPYKRPIIHEVDADGIVKGLSNVYPTMTIKTDTSGVLIEVEYNQDINKNGGNNGLSAYEVAVKNGFKGDETEWLESLKPQKGTDYWTTEDVSQITQQTKESVINDIDDYIVEQGVSGIWTYRKWKSGVAECWGRRVVNTSVGMVSGQMFLSAEFFSETYPFAFAEMPMVNVTSGSSPYMGIVITAGLTEYQASTTSTGAFRILRPTTTGDNVCTFDVNFDIKGCWK